MMRRNQPTHDAFADWLDAGQTERPGSGAPADADIDHFQARDGVTQIDALNRRFEQHALASAPKRTSFETILGAAPAPPTKGMPDHSTSSDRKEHPLASQLSYPVSPVPIGRVAFGETFKRIALVAAVVALVLAGSTAAWFGRDQLGFGGGDDNLEPLSYASFMLDDGQEFQLAYDVPTAEECTVEPLTVDQVMEKLNAPYFDPALAAANATAKADLAAGTPQVATPVPPHHDYTLPEATHTEMAAAQREWLACSLFGTPFQRWALETHLRVQDEFRLLYMPVMDMGLIEQDLEALAAGEESRLSAPTLTGDSLLPMVPSYVDGLYNAVWENGSTSITVFWVRPDGTALLSSGKTLEDLEPYRSASPLEQQLPNTWFFRYNAETGQWLLDDMKRMGG